ncbi:MAG TPA: hypothetical protein VN418_03840 [Gammaproteobacteria bacterium]|nr:hypothetical protein [Gammaproteobacteria bacterium]
MPKTPQRWTNAPPPKAITGERRGRLEDADLAMLLGQVLVAWAHFEDQMISFFEKLLGVQHGNLDTARLIFYALVAQKIRIEVMRKLLQKARHNKSKGKRYDEILDEFEKLNTMRNKYVHGLWWTHENGDTHLQLDNSAFFTHVEYRKVTKKELEGFLSRLNTLWAKVLFL